MSKSETISRSIENLPNIPSPSTAVRSNPKLQLAPTGSLTASTHNSRRHSDKQIDQIAESFRKFGMINPIIVTAGYEVVAGHGRLEAAKKMGLANVPVIIADHLTEPEIRAYRILDNRIAELSTWDEAALATEIQFLIEAELACTVDFTPEITGFSTPQIDVLVTRNELREDKELEERIPAPAAGSAISKAGDVWHLGSHRIICGDSRDAEAYSRILGASTVQLICTDPPYNVKISGFASGNGVVKHEDFSMACGEMSSAHYTDFLKEILTHSQGSLEEGACVYAFIDWRHVNELQLAANQCKLTLLNICVWDKGVGGMGSFYRSQHEFVCVFRNGNTSHRNNIQLGKFGRNRTNVWSYPSANSCKEGRKVLKNHPTPKPVSMIADIIRDVTKVGDVVLDPFLGSGTTIIAAEKTRRRGYGIEMDPAYVDVAITRWQEFSGKSAVHHESGLTFAEVKGAREVNVHD